MAAKKGKKRSKQTLKEFQAWLSGVEEMQDDGWIPSLDQWTLIRLRIYNIIENVTPVAPPRGNIRHTGQHAVANLDAPEIVSSFDGLVIDPTVPSRAPNSTQGSATVGTTQTPHIDSSTGYKSGFA